MQVLTIADYEDYVNYILAHFLKSRVAHRKVYCQVCNVECKSWFCDDCQEARGSFEEWWDLQDHNFEERYDNQS